MKTFVVVAACLFALLLSSAAECQINYGSNSKVGKHADVNDIKLYYEIYGTGEPLLLLHGDGGSIAVFSDLIPALSKQFKVIAVDSRAQGKSTDSDKEITYALMATDVSALIEQLHLGSVYVLGWSDGGNVGLELAVAHPEEVKKLITFGANFTHENFMATHDNIVMDADDPRLLKTTAMVKMIKKMQPEPSPLVTTKLEHLMNSYPNLTIEQLTHIQIPVLVVAGDHDAISLEQTTALFKSLPHAQLWIVPGASHFVVIEQPETVGREVIEFLAAPYRDIATYYWMDLIK
jgi:pimeloyl-ACP methyl ester carboxylesterase